MSVAGVLEELRSRYRLRREGAGEGEINLAAFISEMEVADSDPLAEVIELDGQLRFDAGLAVDLERYLEAVPRLADRDVPLDAAIEYSLRALTARTGSMARAVEALTAKHPALASAIRDAAVLGESVVLASDLAELDGTGEVPEFPRGFGPRLPTGRPRYVLRERLGQGSHGAVYLAVDRQLSQQARPALVAIKVMTQENDAGARKRLIEEAAKARRIEHPNVVRILDRGRSPRGEDYVVFEYVPGGDLDTWFRNHVGALPARETAGLASKIARGVQAAHSAGLVHCDLKPGNILLGADGSPKVADFGVAAPHEEGKGAEGMEGRRVGNLAFIAPEQYRAEPGAITPAADIYALGGMLYYLLTETLPNGRTAEQIAQTHASIGGRQVPPRLERRRGIDRDLEAIVHRAMAVRPQARYASAEAFAGDLESWLAHRPIEWTRPGVLRTARLYARRQPTVVLVAALLVIAALLIGGLAGFQLAMSLTNRDLGIPAAGR
ncbi:MAG: serine/threonine protein kinase [Phycisphaeraceae bacterium]|nr:serine/threonine protein kinase [Phycisphaeraceae bacterium]